MTTYREAGVDIGEGDRLVELIKPLAESTRRPEQISGLGGFAGLFALEPGKYREPVLVSGTDGVGTKLKLAFEANRHETIGIDLVAMCVNDIVVSGAEPLFFLDYFATSKLMVEQATPVLQGIAEGCRQAGCALIGGETAEMPGFYAKGEYDLAGFALGVVEREEIIDGEAVEVGDAIIGVASTGPHSNGYSLIRRIMEERGLSLDTIPEGLDRPLVDLLLAPTRIYARDILALRQKIEVRAMAHITGGGLPGNVPRTLPRGVSARLHRWRWPASPLFDFLARVGEVPADDMAATFNLGLGLTAVVRKGEVDEALALLRARGLDAWEVGEIIEGTSGAEAEFVWGA